MSSRASRWRGDDTPLTGVHGGSAAAARRAVLESRRALAQQQAAKMASAAKLKLVPARKDRVYKAVPSSPKPTLETRWACRPANRYIRGRVGNRPSRKPLQLAMRKIALRIAQRNICALCSERMPLKVSLDHCVPIAAGGPDRWGNFLLAHLECNRRKSNDDPTGCEIVWLIAVNARLGWELTKGLLA